MYTNENDDQNNPEAMMPHSCDADLDLNLCSKQTPLWTLSSTADHAVQSATDLAAMDAWQALQASYRQRMKCNVVQP